MPAATQYDDINAAGYGQLIGNRPLTQRPAPALLRRPPSGRQRRRQRFQSGGLIFYHHSGTVIPAQAGIQRRFWNPACAGAPATQPNHLKRSAAPGAGVAEASGMKVLQ